jgi:hypothetical protein
LQFARIPESSTSWLNTPPSTVNQTITDGSTFNRTYNAANDGSYTENDSIVGTTNTITVNSNGSGTYYIPANNTGGPVTLAAAAPVAGNITLTLTVPGLASNPITKTITSWLPTPLVLYSDSTQDMGMQPIASSCGNLSSVSSPTTAEELVRTTKIADPVLGYTENRTVTSWDLGSFGTSGKTTGPICVVISDVENLYYDYSFVTTHLIAVAPNAVPLQVSTINESFALSATPVNLSIRRSSMSTAPVLARINAHLAGITFARSIARARRLETFNQAIHRARQGGAQ